MPETCPNGHPVADGAPYCPHCGSAVGDPTAAIPAAAEEPDPTLAGWEPQQGWGPPQQPQQQGWGPPQQPQQGQQGWGPPQQPPQQGWGQPQQGQQGWGPPPVAWNQPGGPPPPGATPSRTKKTTGALIAVAALILAAAAVAVVVLVGFGGSNTARTSLPDWPAPVRHGYLTTCERSQSISFCTCTFNYLQRNVPLSRYTSALSSGYLAQVEGPADAACQTNFGNGNGNGPSPGGGFNSGGSTFGS